MTDVREKVKSSNKVASRVESEHKEALILIFIISFVGLLLGIQ